MVKITEMVRDSRNSGCPAVHAVDGDLRLAQGETVSAGMALVQGYQLDDPDASLRSTSISAKASSQSLSR